MDIKQATRIQTSVLNGLEKKILVWMAERQPKWVTSNFLSFIGFVGAVVIAVGFILSDKNINYLWISSLGLLINWFGDSMDGTLARVRNTQRPIFGYYLDHILDGVNESIMFIGAGISTLMHLPLSLFVLLLYLLITINVSLNAHLRREFKLTYLKMGPTEFRIAIVIANTITAPPVAPNNIEFVFKLASPPNVVSIVVSSVNIDTAPAVKDIVFADE